MIQNPQVPRRLWPKGTFRVIRFSSLITFSELIDEYEKLEQRNPVVSGPLELSDDEIATRLDIVFAASNVYEVTAAADTLFDSYESYLQILDAICLRVPELTKRQKKVAAGLIEYLGADSGFNRRSIMGKNHQEITRDSLHFQTMRSKAEIIKNQCLHI